MNVLFPIGPQVVCMIITDKDTASFPPLLRTRTHEPTCCRLVCVDMLETLKHQFHVEITLVKLFIVMQFLVYDSYRAL